MICGHTHRYQFIEPDGKEHDFPIIINAHTTSLEADATRQKMVIVRKDTEGKILNRFEFGN
jgi:acid phosphatase type 7